MRTIARHAKTTAITGLTAVVLIACTSSPTPRAGQVSGTHGSALQAPFGRSDVDDLVHSLATVGIGVYHVGDNRPDVPIAGPPSPMRLTDDQAAAAALGVWAHAGVSGAALDQLVPASSLRPGAPALPTAAVVAGWASAVDTPAARLARSLMGRPDWSSFDSVVYPSVALTLFASDIASHALAAAGTYQAVPVAYTRPLAAASTTGACSDVLNFINGTVTKVFDAIGHLNTDVSVFSKLFGGLAGKIFDGIVSFGAAAINKAIDAARSFVVDGVEIVLGPFLNVLATIAGTVAVATQVGQLLQPWVAKLVPDPDRNAKGVDVGLSGQVHLTVTTTSGPTGDWPPLIKDCADAVHAPLPPLRPHGGNLTWNVNTQAPLGLVTMTSSDAKLSDIGTAAMHYLTGTEDAETAKGEAHPGFVLPEVNIHRTDLDELTAKLTNLFNNAIPRAIPDVIKGIIREKLTDALNAALQRLDIVTKDQQVSAVLPVTFHTPGKTKPTGGCAASPAGTYTGSLTASGSVTTPHYSIDEAGGGPAVMTVSAKGRLNGTWSATWRGDGSGAEDDGTPIEAHVTVTTRDGTFGGTLQHPTVSGSASEAGLIHVGAVHINGPIVTDLPFTGPMQLTACPPRITAQYALPLRVGRITVNGTAVFTLTRR